jgi:hypothetical protein
MATAIKKEGLCKKILLFKVDGLKFPLFLLKGAQFTLSVIKIYLILLSIHLFNGAVRNSDCIR